MAAGATRGLKVRCQALIVRRKEGMRVRVKKRVVEVKQQSDGHDRAGQS